MLGITALPSVLRFGVFELNTRIGELRKKGIKVRLQEQSLQILAVLLEHPGELVSREHLRTLLWPADTFVDFEHGVNAAIHRLRTALGDSSENPRYVETVPRRGYRFIGPLPEPGGPIRRHPNVQKDKIRLAVLPLSNFSEDPSQEYFSDGLTEELITQLGGYNPQQLGVIARTSVQCYKSSRKSIADIGSELGVDYVVEGSVRRVNDRVRISAQLIQVSDQMHIWAQNYERNLQEILKLQDEVSRAIAHQILVQLGGSEPAPSSALGKVSPRAYDEYLRGRHHWTSMCGDGFRKAYQCFDRAIQEDPSYARSYVGLADCCAKFGQFGFVPPREAFSRAREAVLQAISLDPQLAEAHASLAIIHFLYDWDWQAAEREFQLSIQLLPTSPIVHAWFGMFLTAMGRNQEALEQLSYGLELEPLGHITNGLMGWYFHVAGQREKAMAWYRRAIEIYPKSLIMHCLLGTALTSESRFSEAISELQVTANLAGTDYITGYLGLVYARSGQVDQLQKLSERLQERLKSAYIPALSVAYFYAGLGDMDRFFDWLEKAYEERNSDLCLLPAIPDLDPLRSHPRFQALMKQMNFPA